MKFEVKRREWIRGGRWLSVLYQPVSNRCPDDPDIRRCCLGFFANACGISDRSLGDWTTPTAHQRGKKAVPPEWAALTNDEGTNTKLCLRLMINNDDPGISDEIREEVLTALFAKLGHRVSFVD